VSQPDSTVQGGRTFALSPNQRLLWHMARLRPDLGALTCPMVLRLRGEADPDAIRDAVEALVVRHDALRTTFHGTGRRVCQVLAPPERGAPLEFQLVDLTGEADPEAALKARLATELATPVELARAPLRCRLYRLARASHVLCVTIHHLVTDAWSTGVLLEDFVACYAEVRGLRSGRRDVPGSFTEVLRDGAAFVSTPAFERQREFWVRTLRGARLPDVPRGEIVATGGDVRSGMVARTVAPESARGIARLASTAHTTPFAVGLAAFCQVLSRVTGQQDVAVASMFANRLHPESRSIVGFLANMVLLRTRRPPDGTGLALVRAAHATVTAALAHQAFPFHLLPPGVLDTTAGRPDDVVFQFMTDIGTPRVVGDLLVELELPEQIGNRFGLELAVAPVGTGYRAVLFYRLDWTDRAWAERFLDEFAEALHLLARDPAGRLP
jgi:Condensation domain